MAATWMLYGAYGFTGQLIVAEALERGHRPILAGRSAEKLLPLAERNKLQARVIDLQDGEMLRRELTGIALVLHAAGPYSQTSQPVLSACLDSSIHYLDLTGELPVFQHTLSLDAAARAAGICLVSGAGFDVIPTDCLAMTLARQIADPVHLELAVAGMSSGISAGTLKSAIGILAGGGLARRAGRLVPAPVGGNLQRACFAHGWQSMMSAPLGDLVTAYASTGIGNITTYIGYKQPAAALAGVATQLLAFLLRSNRIRRMMESQAERLARPPDASARAIHRSYVWGRVSGQHQEAVEATLELPEAYRFTALAAVRAVEAILEHRPTGALTPAQAFGADFIDQFVFSD